MLDWLKKNKRFIKISAIEQHLNMPNTTLIKAVNGTQNLSEKKWKKPLEKFLMDLQDESTSNCDISHVSENNIFDASHIFHRGSNIENDNLFRVNGYRRALVELMDEGVIKLSSWVWDGINPDDYR